MDRDTPPGIEPPSDGVHHWVRFQLIRILDRMNKLEKALTEMCENQEEFDKFIVDTKVRLAEGVKTFQDYDGRFLSITEQIKELKAIRAHNNPGNDNENTVTFKWILEKLALPILMLIAGAVIALVIN